MIIAVDFDGTIVEHIYPSIGIPVPGALKWLITFQRAGAQIILWTMRSDDKLQEAVDYLESSGVELWGVNENPEQSAWTNSTKQYAQIYIDDAAFGCPLIFPNLLGARPYVDWEIIGPKVLKQIENDYKESLK